VFGLRRLEGVDLADWPGITGVELHEFLEDGTLDSLLDDGLLQIADGHLRLTRRGLFLADLVSQRLIEAAQPG
jgi:coproporphyrinogen III oxidase-like Fe-S oxidoreductase